MNETNKSDPYITSVKNDQSIQFNLVTCTELLGLSHFRLLSTPRATCTSTLHAKVEFTSKSAFVMFNVYLNGID